MIQVVNKHNHTPGLNDVYIGRGSPLGNPFTHIKDRNTKAHFIVESREEAMSNYGQWLEQKIREQDKAVIGQLDLIARLAARGDVKLVCYCKPKSCHGDTILSYTEERLRQGWPIHLNPI
jgi:hypothetical protein